jgi:recombination protein RecA
LGGESVPWCAFIDPSASLFAPGVARLGVELSRLLVVRPDIDAVERTAVRIAEARAVAMLVIDLRGALGSQSLRAQSREAQSREAQSREAQSREAQSREAQSREAQSGHRWPNPRWPSAVRRLALSIKDQAARVLLITSADSPRALPLPVAMRLEFARASASHFELRVAKERTGRVSSPRLVPWSVFEEAWR